MVGGLWWVGGGGCRGQRPILLCLLMVAGALPELVNSPVCNTWPEVLLANIIII